MAQSQRPLSPHMSIYRPQLTANLSIIHRMTGVGLAVGTVFITVWLLSAAWSADAFHWVQGFYSSILGNLVLFGFSLCLFYHLCNGIRHLLWDIGMNLEIRSVYRSGWIMLFFAAVLTTFAWTLALDFADIAGLAGGAS
ncbi:MAG: succinate dehydrogenase, cytochrome b556 subunit [Alphaproteobacteria bacterium]